MKVDPCELVSDFIPNPQTRQTCLLLTNSRIITHMRINLQKMPKLDPPPLDILNKPRMRQQRHLITIHQPLRLQPKHIIRLAQNNKQRDLTNHPAVTRRALRRTKQHIRLLDRLPLRYHRRPTIRNTKVMIKHIQQIPQPRSFKRILPIFVTLLLTVKRLEKALMEIQLRRNPDTVAREFPREVGQPEGGDAEGADVVERVEAVEHGGGDEVAELAVAEEVDLFFAGDVQ